MISNRFYEKYISCRKYFFSKRCFQWPCPLRWALLNMQWTLSLGLTFHEIRAMNILPSWISDKQLYVILVFIQPLCNCITSLMQYSLVPLWLSTELSRSMEAGDLHHCWPWYGIGQAEYWQNTGLQGVIPSHSPATQLRLSFITFFFKPTIQTEGKFSGWPNQGHTSI